MQLKKIFLGWDIPFVQSVARLCTEIQVQSLKVVVPNLEISNLLNLEIQRLELNSVKVVALKQFFAELINNKLTIANTTIRIFTWQKVLEKTDIAFLHKLFPGEFKYGNTNLFSLARLINQITENILVTNKDYQQVIEICETHKIDNADFWSGLNILFAEYISLLAANNYIDANYELKQQNKFKSNSELAIIAGCQNLNLQAVKIIDALSDSALIAINAPEQFSEGYTEHGALNTSYWDNLDTKINSENIIFCESATDEITLVSEFCKANRKITLYPLEESILKLLPAELTSNNIQFENHVSQKLNSNQIIKLILTIIDYCVEDRADNFSRLIREVNIRNFISKFTNASELIHQANLIRSNYFPQNLSLDCPILNKKLEKHSTALNELSKIIKAFKSETSLEKAISNLISSLVPKIDEEDSKCLSILLENTVRIDESKLNNNTLKSIKEVISSLSYTKPTQSSNIKLKTFSDLTFFDSPEIIVLGISDETLPSKQYQLIYKQLADKMGIIDYSISNASYTMAFLSHGNIDFKLFNSKLSIQDDALTPSRFLFKGSAAENSERILKFTDAVSNQKPHEYKTYNFELPAIKETEINKISASSFRDYIKCPYLFYLKHILKIESSTDHQLEMNGAVFGKLAHLILEDFSNTLLSERSSIDAAFISAAEKILNKFFPWTTYPAVSLQIEQLKNRIEVITEVQKKLNKQNWKIHSVEVPIEDSLIINGKTIKVTGKIDRIDINTENNSLLIIDFKTSDTAVSLKKISLEDGWTDLQLPIYALWAKRNYPDKDLHVAYINFSKQNAEIDIELFELDETLLNKAKEQINLLAKNIIENKFTPANYKEWPDELIYDRTVQNN